MGAIQTHRRTLPNYDTLFPPPNPRPILWFDPAHGLSADLSTWQARVGDYTATQANPAYRFARVADARPNWLATNNSPLGSGLPDSSMAISPAVPLSYAAGFTALVPMLRTVISDEYTQTLCAGPQLNLYAYKDFAEFYVPDGNGGGSNPAVQVLANVFGVLSGDAEVGRSPSSSRTYFDYSRLETNIVYNRTGYLNGLEDGNWTIGGNLTNGRLAGLVLFDRVLTVQERFDWVAYLAARP